MALQQIITVIEIMDQSVIATVDQMITPRVNPITIIIYNQMSPMVKVSPMIPMDLMHSMVTLNPMHPTMSISPMIPTRPILDMNRIFPRTLKMTINQMMTVTRIITTSILTARPTEMTITIAKAIIIRQMKLTNKNTKTGMTKITKTGMTTITKT